MARISIYVRCRVGSSEKPDDALAGYVRVRCRVGSSEKEIWGIK